MRRGGGRALLSHPSSLHLCLVNEALGGFSLAMSLQHYDTLVLHKHVSLRNYRARP